MRTVRIASTLVAVVSIAIPIVGHAQSANGTSGSSGASPTTITGQSTAGQSLTSQTVPAPSATTPPINPSPGTSSTLAGPPRRAGAKVHTRMGSSNSYQNGVNGLVQSNGVVTG